ncbi:hepcidin-like [Chaetodon trifascialis]|uniref:hepcidin-like n=1 Tax=Chaetodon trifascialis TaxID=109706 RepID=UPI0039927155
MKTFSVAVAVAVVLTFICLQQSSAVPVSEVEELEEPMSLEHLEIPVELWTMPYSSRMKRHSSPARCKFCCGCCPNMHGCGVCCRF